MQPNLTDADIQMLINLANDRVNYWKELEREGSPLYPSSLAEQQVKSWSALLEKLEAFE